MTHEIDRSLHLVQSTDWKDAVITLLEPSSPYRPWRAGISSAKEGDLVAYVLDTDPASVLTETARVGTDGDPLTATFDRPLYKPTLMELSTLATMVGHIGAIDDAWTFDGDDAVKLELALDDCKYISPPASRFGHNSMAAARTMLQTRGRCEGCEGTIDLARSDARDQIFVHTVDPYVRRPTGDAALSDRDWVSGDLL